MKHRPVLFLQQWRALLDYLVTNNQGVEQGIDAYYEDVKTVMEGVCKEDKDARG
jgi:hypothetical protein